MRKKKKDAIQRPVERVVMRVLILASYCTENGCTEAKPCPECLKMCNVAMVPVSCSDIIGQFDLLNCKPGPHKPHGRTKDKPYA